MGFCHLPQGGILRSIISRILYLGFQHGQPVRFRDVLPEQVQSIRQLVGVEIHRCRRDNNLMLLDAQGKEKLCLVRVSLDKFLESRIGKVDVHRNHISCFYSAGLKVHAAYRAVTAPPGTGCIGNKKIRLRDFVHSVKHHPVLFLLYRLVFFEEAGEKAHIGCACIGELSLYHGSIK